MLFLPIIILLGATDFLCQAPRTYRAGPGPGTRDHRVRKRQNDTAASGGALLTHAYGMQVQVPLIIMPCCIATPLTSVAAARDIPPRTVAHCSRTRRAQHDHSESSLATWAHTSPRPREWPLGLLFPSCWHGIPPLTYHAPGGLYLASTRLARGFLVRASWRSVRGGGDVRILRSRAGIDTRRSAVDLLGEFLSGSDTLKKLG